MQLVVVKVRDMTSFSYWATKEEVDESKCKVVFVAGWLVEENEEITKVALLCSEDKHALSDWIDIPTPSIVSCDVIKEVDWEETNA